MRTAIIALVLLLLPAAICAAPTMGVYFTYNPAQMHYSPMVPFEMFDGYLYIHNSACYLTAVEFMLSLPPGIVLQSYQLPAGALSIGTLTTGIAITYWPPMDGWTPGYNLLCTMRFLAIDICYPAGALLDAPIGIVAHPETGRIDGTCYPDYELFDILGLTSTICPHEIAVEQTSWGTIKALYR